MYNETEVLRTIKNLEYEFQCDLLRSMDKTQRLIELIDERLLRKIKFKEAVRFSVTDLGFGKEWWAIYHSFAMKYYAPHHSYRKRTPIETVRPSDEVHKILEVCREGREKRERIENLQKKLSFVK